MKEHLRGNSSVLQEVGTQSGFVWIEVYQWAAVVWTWVIKQNGKFRNQGSREKFGSVIYPNLLGFTVSFVPFPKETFSDPLWVTPPHAALQILPRPTHQALGATAPALSGGAQSQKHNAVWWCNGMIILEKWEELRKNVINLYLTST